MFVVTGVYALFLYLFKNQEMILVANILNGELSKDKEIKK